MFNCKHPRGNTVITESFYVLGDGPVMQVPGCICAYVSDGFHSRFTIFVVHEDGRTKVLIAYKDFRYIGFKTVLELDELVDIINISEYVYNRGRFIFSTAEGVKFILGESGELMKPEHMIHDHRICKHSVGVLKHFNISYDGMVIDTNMCGTIVDRFNGYRDHYLDPTIGWRDNKIFDLDPLSIKDNISLILTHHGPVEDVYATNFSFFDRNNNSIINLIGLMILCMGIIHVKLVEKYGGHVFKTYKLKGKWTTAPFLVDGIPHVVDVSGILRDMRIVWKEYREFSIFNRSWKKVATSPDMLHSTEPSLFEQGIVSNEGGISIYHGMRVFTPALSGE